METLDKVALYQLLFFNLFLDKIVWVWPNSVDRGIRDASKMVKSLMFGDNKILLSTTEDDLQRMLHSLKTLQQT